MPPFGEVDSLLQHPTVALPHGPFGNGFSCKWFKVGFQMREGAKGTEAAKKDEVSLPVPLRLGAPASAAFSRNENRRKTLPQLNAVTFEQYQ
jgi:hypothetical protein